MNRTTYLAAVSNWKQTYADHSENTRGLKRQIHDAELAFTKHFLTLSKDTRGYLYHDSTYWQLSGILCKLLNTRTNRKKEATELLEKRHQLKALAQTSYLLEKAIKLA